MSIAELRREPVLYVWLLLVGSTLASWWVGSDGVAGERTAIVLVLAVAFFKAWLVGRWFMELRTAPIWLARAFDGWVLVTAVAVTAIYAWG